ncbi:hypothetical protein, partial [Enterobacter hormaechei]
WFFFIFFYQTRGFYNAVVNNLGFNFTAFSIINRHFPVFNYFFAAAGVKSFRCALYGTFGTRGV